MANNDEYSKFMGIVRGICDTARSGTLSVRTGDRHAAMILFDRGNITGAYYGSIKGKNAITLLRASGGLTYHFEDGRPPVVRQDLGSPAETLAALAGEAPEKAARAAPQPVR